MNQDIWRYVSPLFSQYDQHIHRYPTLQAHSFFSCQPRAKQALECFAQRRGFSRVLIVNAPDNSIYRDVIVQEIKKLRLDVPVLTSENLDYCDIFPRVKNVNGHVQLITGLLDSVNGGYLVLSPNWLIRNAKIWPVLKSALLGYPIRPFNADDKSPIDQPVDEKIYDIKLVLVGEREQLANLEYLDGDLRNGLSSFCELELELKLTDSTIEQYLGYLKWVCQTYQFPELTDSGIKALMRHGVRRFTEDQHYVPLCLFWLNQLLEEATMESLSHSLDEKDIVAAINHQHYRESYLPQRALSDILDGQVVIETQGSQVGQVNGLTVIDVAGHPLSYGEPARISCVVHFGDGDISDVERKVDLGGNLHAKGMMIMQAFVSSALNFDEPLPYSASIVFEQSYSEVDGDSASLAEVISFVSALSGIEINQEVAVTGAVDQFGRVQAVGGLNEKIEGFYHVCLHQGLTGKQGVILPKSNLRNLALHPDLVESIKKSEFHIFPVETVDEAIPLLMGKPFRGDSSVIEKIAERIDELDRNHSRESLWLRLKSRLTSFY